MNVLFQNVLVFSEHADGADAEDAHCAGLEAHGEHLLSRVVRDAARTLTRRSEIVHLQAKRTR